MGWFIATGILAFIVFAIAVSGRDSNRRGTQDNIDRAKKIKDGTDRAGGINTEIGNGIDRAKEITDDISGNNKDASDGIDAAIDILEKAKDKQPPP